MKTKGEARDAIEKEHRVLEGVGGDGKRSEGPGNRGWRPRVMVYGSREYIDCQQIIVWYSFESRAFSNTQIRDGDGRDGLTAEFAEMAQRTQRKQGLNRRFQI